MDKSANQSRLSRSQLPPQEAGSAGLSLDQLTDLDQAISLSRGGAPASARPATKPLSKPSAAPLSKPLAKPSPKSLSGATSQTAPKPAPEPVSTPPVVPVRSAKEAINAMYAGENPARLSDYLGASAKDIINASARPATDSKSAASLHHASSQRRMEAARPSASALFRAAKSETTVVHTSLELEPQPPRRPTPPKRPSVSSILPDPAAPASKPSPIVINSRSRAANPSSRVASARPSRVASVLPKKGRIKVTTPSATSIAVSAIEQAADAVASAAKSSVKSSARPAGAGFSAASRPRPPRSRSGLLQDIARPAAKPVSKPLAKPTQKPLSASAPSPVSKSPLKRASEAPDASLGKSSRAPHAAKPSANPPSKPSADPYQKLPADSVKRRFRLAPKGFAAKKPEQARPARRKFMSFSNPDYTVPVPKPSPAVEIYGLTEPDPATERSDDGLGIVEDYRPTNPTNPAMNTAASDRAARADAVAGSSPKGFAAKKPEQTGRTPDNNRYALGGQSPFFLKSVSVEKRPLSDAPTRRADTISPLYTDPGDEVPRKNVYDGKSAPKPLKSAKKPNPRDLPQRPTVIIPSSRRSHTPLFLLLILTVILGAAVGAAVYFFFFQ